MYNNSIPILYDVYLSKLFKNDNNLKRGGQSKLQQYNPNLGIFYVLLF